MKYDSISLIRIFLLATLFSLTGLPGSAHSQISDDLYIRGYVQGMPVRISADLPEPLGEGTWMEYRLQNRLNIRWDATSDFSFHWQMRTRFFAGDLVKEFREYSETIPGFPDYAEGIDTDDGLVNLSWLMFNKDNWLLHFIPDRLYGEWDSGDWNIRVGRQRVNWGVNMITNPNDIFNIYSFYDFDYPERPGTDAIRVQHFLGFSSRFELAVSPSRDLENSVAAALYTFNTRGYDFQFIGGYYRERLTTGAGWAGNLRGAGFKGETMFYADIDEQEGDRNTNFIVSASVDYMFPCSLFMITELLYNQAGGREQFQLIGEQLAPDNPSFSKYQLTTQLTYPIHMLVDGGLAAIYYPDEEAVFISPSVTWSVITDLDLRVLAQFFTGSDDSVFGSSINIITASLKYNF